MMPTSKPPALQVLFEPFPNPEQYQSKNGAGAFAGMYWFDALDPDGSLREHGYRATFEGCPYCRRSDDDPKAHWDIRNDGPAAPKRLYRCGRWGLIEKIVKAFGGWKRVHYVELAEHEGLKYRPIPQRRRIIEACTVCNGSGYLKGWAKLDPLPKRIPRCDAGCGSYTYQGRGEVQVTYEGPVRPDRHGMTAEQLRVRV